MYVWNELKRLKNIEKHGFDFLRAWEILEGAHVVVRAHYPGEVRYLAIGKIQGRFATAILTLRGGNFRIISIRSARDAERREYEKLYGSAVAGDD